MMSQPCMAAIIVNILTLTHLMLLRVMIHLVIWLMGKILFVGLLFDYELA